MSKIINGIKEIDRTFVESGILYPILALMALPSLIFGAYKDSLYISVLVAYVLAVGFAVVQWDRGQYKQSNGFQIGMAVMLVMVWSSIGNDNKWVPLFVLIGTTMFIMQFYYWTVFFVSENKAIIKRITWKPKQRSRS